MIVKPSILLLCLFSILSHGKPVREKSKTVHSKSHHKAPEVKTNTDALKFLGKFGYNKCDDGQKKPTAGEPLCESSFETMIEHFQTVFHLPVTKKLDKQTIKLMNTPRCSLGDYPLGYSAFRPWPNTTLKWKLNNYAVKLGEQMTRSLITEAFNDWARYANLKFDETTGDRASFSVSFVKGNHDDGYSFDGPGGTLAHGFFPTDGRVHFDSEELWTDKYDGFDFNLRLVASHEIGHALGLAHSFDPKALMYPFYQLIQPKDLLPKDDRDGIRALYGTSATNIPTTFAPATATTTNKVKHTKKPIKLPTKHSHTTASTSLSHDRCARYLDAVFSGPGRYLYTLDYDLLWRFHPDFGHWDTEGQPTIQAFPGAEPHMMAGILSPKTQNTYLFKGARVWRFSPSNALDAGFPKRLSGTGTPYNPIAALYDEGHIWLLKGDLLFKFNEDHLSYKSDKPPKRINEYFRGIPKHVRTAFTYEGKHYFFTEPDRKVYIFDAKKRKLEPGYPKPMTTGWFACNVTRN